MNWGRDLWDIICEEVGPHRGSRGDLPNNTIVGSTVQPMNFMLGGTHGYLLEID